jgi:hypothetical protein
VYHWGKSSKQRPKFGATGMASNERPGDDDEENGIDWQGLGRRLRVDKQTARTVVEYVGPHLSWIVAAIAWGIFIVSTFWAWSLIK